jgi:hypothetical protein
MSERPRAPRSRGFVRVAGIIVAFGLTIVAVWMIALGGSEREVRLGVITGLWAALIGAMTFYGGRTAGTRAGDIAGRATGFAGPGAELDVRQDYGLELEREASARRAYEQQLHEMVRREIETIQRVVGDQLGRLREDVSSLRGDLVDQVGGKIRLERIETTRVIGSDIEALQNEVRQLAGGRNRASMSDLGGSSSRVFDAAPQWENESPRSAPAREPAAGAYGQPGTIRPAAAAPEAAVPAAPVARSAPFTPPVYAPQVPPAAPVVPMASRPVPVAPAASVAPPAYQPFVPPTYSPPVAPSVVDSRPITPPPPGSPLSPARAGVAPGATSRPAFEPLVPQIAMAPVATAAPVAPTPPRPPAPPAPVNGSSMGSDPFAGLPRLSRFDDIGAEDASTGRPSTPAAVPVPPATSATGPAFANTPAASNGRRHGAPEDEQPPGPPEAPGGRRRRSEGDVDDVLSRLLNER